MKAKPSAIIGIIVSVCILMTIGCSSGHRKSADSAVQGPAWVTKGSGAFDVDGSKVFHGVGAASGINNKALLRQTSDNRARAEIAKILEIYVASLTKDYMAATTAGDMSASSEEQHVETALKTFTKTTLHGATVIDRWMDPEDRSMYSLCELDLVAFTDTLDEYRELDKKVRDFVRDNAERLHNDLERMEGR